MFPAVCHHCAFTSTPLFRCRTFSTATRRSLTQRYRPESQPRFLHGSFSPQLPRRRGFFSSNFLLDERSNVSPSEGDRPSTAPPKRKPSRSPPGKSSLRRVAVEAQRSRTGLLTQKGRASHESIATRTVTAYCVAEQFDLGRVVQILEDQGYEIDPCETGLSSQVVHVRIAPSTKEASEGPYGDFLVFSSGTAVAWSVPAKVALRLVTKTLIPAAENAHVDQLQTEDMEYVEDSSRENSSVRGDTITLGTLPSSGLERDHGLVRGDQKQAADMVGSHWRPESARSQADTVLAKIAFSSGLARSTKLAVLETLLSNYFESTRSIPMMLSRGSRLPFTRSFILRKTGQLLSVRAQLNLYSELTDSLPDLFWDSRHELGLEGYYDQVGRALDVGVRIKVLNEKMDYAQEIASVLRERLSEKHGLVLEWMIIALITIEVAFEVLRLWKESKDDRGDQLQVRREEPIS